MNLARSRKVGSEGTAPAARPRQAALVDLEIDPENVDVNKLFKNAAEIGKASVTQKKFSQSVRAEIEAAARKLRHIAFARQSADFIALAHHADIIREPADFPRGRAD